MAGLIAELSKLLIDDETDMAALEAAVRSIEKDGLVWGGSKLVAVGYGIKKLQINLVVEDEKISLDELQEEIQAFEDYVQSTDIVSCLSEKHVNQHWSNLLMHFTCSRPPCKSYRSTTATRCVTSLGDVALL